MKLVRRTAVLLALVALCAAAALATGIVSRGGDAAASANASCQLGNQAGQIKHVIYLQFDNTHYRRDRPNVASDLEQMPHLLQFLKSNGTLFTNDHTILISHTAGGILSSLTGLYPDRTGITVSNSYGFFKPDASVGFSTAFKYWTDQVDAVNDPLTNMITDGQKNTPAPWVPFTRAGCDVGGVGTANIELENTSTAPGGDIEKAFGVPSPQATEASTNPQLAQTDFVGIAIHCSQAATSKCADNADARPDALPDEPGGYNDFNALYGAKYVDPAVAGGPCVDNTTGTPITDPNGNCGFPGFDGMLATNTLGYVEQMQENGVPVTYGYISDAHDFHVPNTSTDAFNSSARGPGEADYQAQLKAYDDAFASFFQNLAAHGIDRSNSLFVVTVDEGDHFAGGIGTPDPANPGALTYTHTSCAQDEHGVLACPDNQIGEVNANLRTLTGRSDFAVHSDDAPTVYVNGNPSRTSPTVRSLEHTLADLKLTDPYNHHGALTAAAESFADPVEEETLHMVNSDPARTPTFTMFGNPDFFFTASDFAPSCGSNPCVSPGFAWNHGDSQEEIGNTWVGFVGPGVSQSGVDDATWTDHTNVRPTILSLVGLHDDYTDDGRVLTEGLTTKATPQSLIAHSETVRRLNAIYEQVNAPFGQFATDTLKASTRGIVSTDADDATYNSIESQIESLTAQRDTLAGQIRGALNAAAFDGEALNEQQAKGWINQGQGLLDAAAALAAAP
jgi:hypothetical protein